MSVSQPNPNPNPEPTAPSTPTTPEANPATPPNQEEPPKVTFSEEQQKELNRLIAAARREGKSAAEAAAQAQQQQAEADAERDRTAAAGNYEAAKNSLIAERDGAYTERDGLKGKLESLLADLKPEIEKRWTDLPAEITALYEGADDDVLAKRSFMTKHAALIEKLATKADAEKQTLRTPRTPNPDPTGTKPTFEPIAPVSI